MRTTNAQMLAVTVLSLVNVWLFWWEARLLMYSQSVSGVIPGAGLYRGIEPVLEIPAAIVLLVAGYLLAYRSTFALWHHRSGSYRNHLLLNAMVINILTGLGIAEWLTFYNLLPVDLIVVVGIGGVAALASFYIEKQPRWPRSISRSSHAGHGRSHTRISSALDRHARHGAGTFSAARVGRTRARRSHGVTVR